MSQPSNNGHQQLTVPLDQLFLDPNNYRFRDEANYVYVREEKVFDADVQRRTTGFILGTKQENVRDLIDSFIKNGWLPVDQIQVREVEPHRYLVVEGNRRVATLKHLMRQYADHSIELGALDTRLFDAVPVNLYQAADQAHHLILMGLKHVSGNRKWPALNQARMLRDLHRQHGLSADDIVKSLGISKREFNLSQNTLALCEMYQKSDWGDQFRSEQYNLFREIVRSPDLRDWLGWDYEQHTVGDKNKLERLFSWLSRIEEEGDEIEGSMEQVLKREPIITTGAHVRELAGIISDEIALRNLEETWSLSEATLSSGKIIKDRVKETLDRIEVGSRTLLSQMRHVDERSLERVDELIQSLEGLRLAKGRAPRVVAGRLVSQEPFNRVWEHHFTELIVEKYRGLRGLRLSGLRRINVFAGFNNAGKTSVLEAAYLISQQHDINALLEIMRRRARMAELPPRWVFDQCPADTRIQGTFDEKSTSLRVTRDQDDSQVEDSAFYVGSISLEAIYGNQRQSSRTDLFSEKRNRVTSKQGQHSLCRAILSSPFSQHDPDMLAQLYEKSVLTKTKDEVLEFLRRTVDEGIENIELANEFKRFLVTHRDMDQAVDLSSFGEGMQRIFHVGLLFSWARDGLVLIDEFENAIHAALLIDFTTFLRKLAREFNTQVFLTTHSKECIDAFVYGGEELEQLGEISYYSLKRELAGTRCEHVSAERLQAMLVAADVDIRRLR